MNLLNKVDVSDTIFSRLKSILFILTLWFATKRQHIPGKERENRGAGLNGKDVKLPYNTMHTTLDKD